MIKTIEPKSVIRKIMLSVMATVFAFTAGLAMPVTSNADCVEEAEKIQNQLKFTYYKIDEWSRDMVTRLKATKKNLKYYRNTLNKQLKDEQITQGEAKIWMEFVTTVNAKVGLDTIRRDTAEIDKILDDMEKAFKRATRVCKRTAVRGD